MRSFIRRDNEIATDPPMTPVADAIVLAAIILALGFRWGMGRLAEAIDDVRKSWEEEENAE